MVAHFPETLLLSFPPSLLPSSLSPSPPLSPLPHHLSPVDHSSLTQTVCTVNNFICLLMLYVKFSALLLLSYASLYVTMPTAPRI